MPQTFTAPPHHDVLQLLIQLSLLLASARLLGNLFTRWGQPSVVGEILAGVLLGPSLLSGLVPAAREWILPQTATQGYLLETISLIGVLFLMMLTGLETDLTLMRRQLRSAVGVAVGGLILPLIVGFLLGMALPQDMLAEGTNRAIFALFLATAMSISAIPVIAKVLMDLNLTRRDIGQVIIASAMIDDTTGWILLSIVAGLAGGAAISAGSILQAVVIVVGFIGLSLTLGRWAVGRGLTFVQTQVNGRYKVLSYVVFCMFVWGAFALALNLEALLGAFLVGIIFSQLASLSNDVVHTLEKVALGIFAPIFFAVAGLKVNILALLTPESLLILLMVIVLATFCKMGGVYVGARLIGRRDHWTALFFGGGLNARGSMEIIVATIGLNLGVLSQTMFSIIVVMAVTTSLTAPFILRYTLRHIQADPAELARLRREDLLRQSLIANVRRILLPARAGAALTDGRLVEAFILKRLHAMRPDADVTLLTIAENATRDAAAQWLSEFSRLFAPALRVTRKVTLADDAADAILQESMRDYDLMIVGATQGRSATADILFTPLVDYLVRHASCPVVIVAGNMIPQDWQPRRILVPTNGSLAAQHGAQLAFALASESSELYVLRVVEQSVSVNYLQSGTLLVRQMAVARQSVDALTAEAQTNGVTASGDIQIGTEPEQVILEYARTRQIDLIILGTSVASNSERLFLGPRVERILRDASCPVIVLNS